MNDFKPGLEGVVAFHTEIAEPDREGGALRYRGVDIDELVGSYHYEQVWGLLVDGSFEPGMPDPEPYEPAALKRLCARPRWMSRNTVWAVTYFRGPTSSHGGLTRRTMRSRTKS